MKMLKTLMLWLLLAAIPLQGLAANAMVICKASHQRASQSPIVHQPVGHHTLHMQHMHQAHDQHHAAQQLSAIDVSTAPDDGVNAGDSPFSKCSASPSCGAISWATAARFTLPGLASPSDCISYVGFHIPGVVPDLPEHPPRLFLV